LATLGIAVVTYRRPDRLKRSLEQVAALTRTPHELVVADDGSDDGTADELRSQNVRVVTGANRGVCWNKNRGLFALMALGCETLVLLEDDIYPDREGWEADWIEAALRWHHVAFAHEKIGEHVLGGTGTPEDPLVNYKATAQCVAVSAQAMRQVGFLDSRFKGYGVGHAEWTTRFKRAG
jgi:glycosyltransferase involved in cell wall biosynthesis